MFTITDLVDKLTDKNFVRNAIDLSAILSVIQKRCVFDIIDDGINREFCYAKRFFPLIDNRTIESQKLLVKREWIRQLKKAYPNILEPLGLP